VKLIVFSGPTLNDESKHSAIDWRGPAARGDIYEATKQKPVAIGLIDGYFENTPSVSHKELLWALSQGIHVLGAGSMGAIRAAELDIYGMRGIGEVYRRFKEENLDDDEVAVVHGPAELDYLPMTVAMVNVRFTLERARAEGVIGDALHQALVGTAKGIFYKQRTWPLVIEPMSKLPEHKRGVQALDAWLPQGLVDQKKCDALELVREISELGRAGKGFTAAFEFRPTQDWESIVKEWEMLVAGDRPNPASH
jgi:hypothetical protein